MSFRRFVLLLTVFVVGFLACHLARPKSAVLRGGHPATIVVYRPAADLAASDTAQEKITLRVVRIVDADGFHDVGVSDARPWEIRLGETRFVCVPVE